MPTKRELQERLTASRAEVARLSELNRDLGASVIAASDKASAKITAEKRLEIDALMKLLSDRDGEIERLKRLNCSTVTDSTEEVMLRAENDMLRRELDACQSEIDRMKES
jgi:hypothetical protein